MVQADAEQGLLPLRHTQIRQKISGWLKIIPWVYNYLYKRQCRSILRDRQEAKATEVWAAGQWDARVVEAVCKGLREYYFWPRWSVFLPQDECYVLWELWRIRIADELEMVSLWLDLEREFSCSLPVEMLERLPEMTLGQWIAQMQRFIQSEAVSQSATEQ